MSDVDNDQRELCVYEKRNMYAYACLLFTLIIVRVFNRKSHVVGYSNNVTARRESD